MLHFLFSRIYSVLYFTSIWVKSSCDRGVDSGQKIFNYRQILSLITVIPLVVYIWTLMFFLCMLILCYQGALLTILLYQHYITMWAYDKTFLLNFSTVLSLIKSFYLYFCNVFDNNFGNIFDIFQSKTHFKNIWKHFLFRSKSIKW